VDLKNLTDKAKDLINKRGGTGTLKEDAEELKDIASRDESLVDKAKDAVEAIKDPGSDDVEATAPPPPTDAPEDPAAVQSGRGAGKGRGQQRGKGGRHGRGRRGRRDGDPAV
jgi:hypothetical protein